MSHAGHHQQGGCSSREGGGKGNNRGGPLSPLEELMRRRGIDEAWNALEEMQRQGLFIDRFTVSRMLMKTAGEGRTRWNPAKVYRGIALVERFITLQPEEADEVLFNALLDTCCRMKDLGRLEATMQRMQELQIYPSHVTLGILVKAYGQAGDVHRVLKVWDDMSEQRKQANAVTYGCMIDACVKCGQVAKAVDIFMDMKRKRKHRNTILYTTLIKGYGLEKDLPNALALFKEMAEEGVPYNTITYNSIIDVCIKCNDVQAAEDHMREMMAPGSSFEPDLITFSTLLKGYCHVGDLDKALQVAETLKACGLKCDELVYNTLMDGCVKANDLSAGIGLFAEMTHAGMKPSSITHSILVRLYQRNGYKGDAHDAVAMLFQHHGLDKPNFVNEHRSGRSSTATEGASHQQKGSGNRKDRQNDRGRDGDQQQGNQKGGGQGRDNREGGCGSGGCMGMNLNMGDGQDDLQGGCGGPSGRSQPRQQRERQQREQDPHFVGAQRLHGRGGMQRMPADQRKQHGGSIPNHPPGVLLGPDPMQDLDLGMGPSGPMSGGGGGYCGGGLPVSGLDPLQGGQMPHSQGPGPCGLPKQQGPGNDNMLGLYPPPIPQRQMPSRGGHMQDNAVSSGWGLQRGGLNAHGGGVQQGGVPLMQVQQPPQRLRHLPPPDMMNPPTGPQQYPLDVPFPSSLVPSQDQYLDRWIDQLPPGSWGPPPEVQYPVNQSQGLQGDPYLEPRGSHGDPMVGVQCGGAPCQGRGY